MASAVEMGLNGSSCAVGCRMIGRRMEKLYVLRGAATARSGDVDGARVMRGDDVDGNENLK
jgi:hypothetical protein